VKDLFSVRGAPTTWGSADFEDQVIDEDAEIVVRLREAGAVLLAKLATGEFARGDVWYRGRTNNPWNTDEGSSGSSAGPGSATAAGCVAFAIGTETRGSIVSPSRRCGLSALRPTFGRVSRYGGMVLSWSMDKVGPMCRPDSFVRALADLGADPRPMAPLPELGLAQLTVESAAAFDFHVAPDGREPLPPPDGLSESELRRVTRFTNGRDVRGMDYLNGQRRRLALMHEMSEAMADFDMFVSGSGEVTLTNDTGHPAVVVPYDFGVRNPEDDSPTTMPLTTVIVGDLFTDDKILSVAHAFQTSKDWHLRRPDLSRLG
jgi:Asp-tRNA(Asn)/Glu-tRNA(Gln) amidotransferase A subunit family amidase